MKYTSAVIALCAFEGVSAFAPTVSFAVREQSLQVKSVNDVKSDLKRMNRFMHGVRKYLRLSLLLLALWIGV